ncbi:hypothetical protein SAMN04487948_13121 [Halogranum amylolyticum]|uniref:Uncharacterized protein n=1 Tax=Halogranum amylolyticum TaxID=660520 RepID=A0A1H8WJE8_9EURY|nr:hypothetical protein [Halogranum amylolyticum]SEP27761.1 hypothetical protein SAMN04487948_13121 [Halogranum amylolyticum]
MTCFVGSPPLLTETIAAFLVQPGARYFSPAQSILGTAPVGLRKWLVLGGVALAIALRIEPHELSWRARDPPDAERELESASEHPKKT